MNKTKSLAELKAAARGHLSGNYSIAIWCTIIFLLLNFILNIMDSLFPFSGNNMSLIISVLGSCIISIVQLKLRFGFSGFILKMSCKGHPSISDLFQCFGNNGGATTVISILITFQKIMCTIPALIALTYFDITNVKSIILAAILLIIAIIYNIYIDIRYSTVFFIVHDIPSCSFAQAILLSKWLIKDNFMKMFFLRLSFLPLLIVGVIPCGLGLILVYPYMTTAMCSFYLNLSKVKSQNN